ncbi:glucose-6-phosphate dehydrogenase [Bombilactobacillus thymidiniphilus]|uniref:Glucose-6-phosphate 1-dehydrogenase n=1 Tax=Bombilactobacillus thymidiniphilus TaxID=2923363 RepID=A0ABY4PED1_9LACO|nr:glucose-6-phosphate dehydrogenase [Bombilactobacillus thymidiniphilus]UQS83902.1 glucose-6-phosphate dehydrogenase [Bombilactobacillus thymidiniphilus]
MAQEQRLIFIIFGGSGDLAHRKLYPALFKLYVKGYLRQHFAVIGTARRQWSHEYFRQTVMESVVADIGDQEQIASFAQHFYYQSHDVNDAEHYIALKKLSAQLNDQYSAGNNQVFYMAVAPKFFGTVASHINSEHLLNEQGFNRLVIEKPFGRDLASAKALNDSISKTFAEDQIYRIDHYLGKEMVQALPIIRFTNPLLAAVWNNQYISNVQITLSETLGVGERAGYYETAGTLRDMIQNHALQILGLIAMDRPAEFTASAIHDQKSKLFSQLQLYSAEQVDQNFVRGQYGPDAKEYQQGYREADNVADDSNTETFVAGKILIDNDTWQGVPFYVRSGKRLRRKATRVDIVFKPEANNIFATKLAKIVRPRPVVLSLVIEPKQGIQLLLNATTPGNGLRTTLDELRFQPPAASLADSQEAYEKLLIDIVEGNQTNFTNWSEQYYTWRFIDRIRKRWDEVQPDFPNYCSNTFGPEASDQLLKKDSHEWIFGTDYLE